MKLEQGLAYCALVLCAFFGIAKTLSGGTQSGDWTIRQSETAGQVRFSLMSSGGGSHSGHNFNYSSDWPVSEFAGVDLSKRARQDVRFTIARDAGKFECE